MNDLTAKQVCRALRQNATTREYLVWWRGHKSWKRDDQYTWGDILAFNLFGSDASYVSAKERDKIDIKLRELWGKTP